MEAIATGAIRAEIMRVFMRMILPAGSTASNEKAKREAGGQQSQIRGQLKIPSSCSSSVVDGEEQAFFAAIARCMSQEFRPQDRPPRVALEFSLMPRLNQKIMRVRRQFVQGNEIGYGRADIKKIRLKVRIDCIKPLVPREERVNLCGNRFNSFVPFQVSHGTQRKDYHRRNNAYRD